MFIVVKGDVIIGIKVLGILVVVGILVDFGILILDVIVLVKIEKGKLCDEVEKLDNVIKIIKN